MACQEGTELLPHLTTGIGVSLGGTWIKTQRDGSRALAVPGHSASKVLPLPTLSAKALVTILRKRGGLSKAEAKAFSKGQLPNGVTLTTTATPTGLAQAIAAAALMDTVAAARPSMSADGVPVSASMVKVTIDACPVAFGIVSVLCNGCAGLCVLQLTGDELALPRAISYYKDTGMVMPMPVFAIICLMGLGTIPVPSLTQTTQAFAVGSGSPQRRLAVSNADLLDSSSDEDDDDSGESDSSSSSSSSGSDEEGRGTKRALERPLDSEMRKAARRQ